MQPAVHAAAASLGKHAPAGAHLPMLFYACEVRTYSKVILKGECLFYGLDDDLRTGRRFYRVDFTDWLKCGLDKMKVLLLGSSEGASLA